MTLEDSASASFAPHTSASAAHRPTPPNNQQRASLSPKDRQIVDAVRAGDPVAGAPLYASLRPSIEYALHRVLHSHPPEFEDLMQIAFERVIRAITAGNFEGRSQLKTWASAIATHVAIDFLRRRTQEQSLFEAIDSPSLDPHSLKIMPERQLEARSELRKLDGVLGRMKPSGAKVLVLHKVLGHSVPQVAKLLGLNANATQSRLKRARQEMLRRCTATARPSTGHG